jgi:hypothetical protein
VNLRPSHRFRSSPLCARGDFSWRSTLSVATASAERRSVVELKSRSMIVAPLCQTCASTAARTAYQASLDIATRLAETDPTNTEWQRDLSISNNKLGDLAAMDDHTGPPPAVPLLPSARELEIDRERARSQSSGMSSEGRSQILGGRLSIMIPRLWGLIHRL